MPISRRLHHLPTLAPFHSAIFRIHGRRPHHPLRSESFSPKNAGEARKLVAELRKYKKGLAPLKTHTVISRQNTAILLDADVDTLIEKFSAPAG